MSTVLDTTVVIATRNRRAELRRTLRELCALRQQPQIVVVDNASTDGTPQLVAEQFPRVRLVEAPRNLGAAARNLGVDHADSTYVAFSDDDSWWTEGSLARAEEIFAEHRGVGLIAARTLVGRDERPDPVNDLMTRSPLRTPVSLPGPRILGFTACAAVVRRRAFRAVGGFNATLFFGAEEKLLACDLGAAGWDLVYVDDVVAHHHPSTARDSPQARRVLEKRNDLLIAWMRYPAGAAVERTLKLLGDSVTTGASRRAVLGAARRLPRALAQRSRLPPETAREVRVLEEFGR
ncbi:Glycosyltransferase, GT2 family [Saccharopolyspora kobensis]|uniref:Glycosyltransferase, GT2 family n=1 Tax=Saccharopolyspora kobensis TaxID=146035 RepID=A0A1H6AFS5_9PSEU|nr:glycosyltransferase [Saccharopolyspora kobensis]SEG46917.1 Glycosyltransferase, GT2 family [Saccharopolyspora kobensis]SFE55358.1 Glycosyltransferase, GT2 family [Saccharopolyspora kobensis]